MKKIIPFLLLFSGVLMGSAQIPEGLNYQCVVRNAAGQPVLNSAVKIRFSILQFMGGTVLYSEEHNSTTNQLGIITAVIGQGTPVVASFGSVEWETGNKFLKVETDIGNTGTYADMGTTQLLSVPYALVAKKCADGIAYQHFDSYVFSTAQRGTDVPTGDSMVVEKTGTYMVTLVAEGYGLEFNLGGSGNWGDNGVYLDVKKNNIPLVSSGLFTYALDDAGTMTLGHYKLIPRKTSEITVLPLQAGDVLIPSVRILTFGTGGTNTSALGYLSMSLTIVKLQ